MSQFFGFSKAQMRMLTVLAAVAVLAGGYRLVRDYYLDPDPDYGDWQVEALDEFEPTLILDPNLAPADSLELIPGIGAVLAEKLVAYRDRHGRFEAIDSLIKVNGIGPEKLEQLRPFLKITQP